ncbi:MAG: TIM barrel protein [Candidatus Undinarchaeales archaeon]|jgi:deoxyribonuclease-4|nr:TIM barrel protein [Candidatus Undinarchaeales archaeon]
MNQLLFGTAGVPISSTKSDSASALEKVKELGLGCMELEFVRGVRMGEATAKTVAENQKKTGIVLSAHAPYYINLNSQTPEKQKASINRILKTARIANICGAKTFTFHAGFFMGQEPAKVYEKIKIELKSIVKTLRDEGNKILVRPETTGKLTQFSGLEDLCMISQELSGVLPCVDFAHLHARTGGKDNTTTEFRTMLEVLEKTLGRKVLDNMHIHMSGINYTAKGERNHLVLEESDFKWRELLKVWKEFNIKGIVISESPNIEEDALLMQNFYKSLKP